MRSWSSAFTGKLGEKFFTTELGLMKSSRSSGPVARITAGWPFEPSFSTTTFV